MSLEGWAIVGTLIMGFTVHIFFFGSSLGELKSNVRHLSKSFDEFKEKNYLTRDEYEARQKEWLNILSATIVHRQ